MELLAKKKFTTVVLKRAETRNCKRFLKKKSTKSCSKINVGMAGWRHWLTKYTDKERTLLHFTPYISSSDMLVGTIFTAAAVGGNSVPP